MKRSLLLAPSLLVALGSSSVVGCSSGGSNGGSLYDEQMKNYSACISSETQSLAASSTDGTSLAPKGPITAQLVPTDVATFTSVYRTNLKTASRQQLEATRIQTIASQRCEALRPHNDYEDSSSGTKRATSNSGSSSSSGGYAAGAGEDSAATAKQASGTNNQVAGVDEADFVKNDNKYIYVANGSHFRVIDAFPGASMHELSSTEIKGKAKKLFVEGNRALVYSSVERQTSSSSSYSSGWYGGGYGYYGGSSGECTYGHDGCVPSDDGTETEISIFDITDKTAPKLVRSIHSSSSLIAARRIGNAVHTVLGQNATGGGIPYLYPKDLPQNPSEAQINAAYAKLATESDAQIDAAPIDTSILPKWSDSKPGTPAQGVYTSSIPDGNAMTSVLSLDLASDAAVSVTSIIGRPGWVYASDDSLYLAVPHQQSSYGWFDGQTESELSTVHKFHIGQGPNETQYRGSGLVKGRVLNELAMDDKDGFLRIATTTGHLPSPDAHNTMSVLEEKGGALSIAGEIDNIAPGEDIRSARFDGDHGYIVTFKKTDPLFVFDLSNPRAPKLQGELKIPGFSTYMHLMDPTHLLTIGYDAADQGDFAWFTGVILQIFDVTNPAAPSLLHKESIGTRGSSSEALANHLAFNYFAPKNLLAIPMTICEGGDQNGNYGTDMTFSGLMVYDVTVADGFKLRGKVAHPSVDGAPNQYGYYNSACSNWWENANSEVKRSIIMDDWVYSVSDSRIKANALSNLSQDVKEVTLDKPEAPQYSGDY